VAGIPDPEPPVLKTLSQISEDLYLLESALLRDPESALWVYTVVSRIRQDLEPHICTPAAHDTPREGTVQEGGTR
jgi:hypothetical protein